MNSSRWRSLSPRHFALLSVAALGVFCGACVSDDPAPRCFHINEAGKCVLVPPGQRLELSCTDLGNAVVRANYSYTPTLAGSSGDVVYTATNLPKGLSIDPKTGVISGKVSEADLNGATTIEDISLKVVDETFGIEATAECGDLDFEPGLAIDASALPDGCVQPGDDLNEIATGGTGTTFTCRLPGDKEDDLCAHGSGNGYLPNGLSFSEDCKINGEISQEAEGTYVWVGLVEQDGAQVAVPFCARRNGPEPHTVAAYYKGTAIDAMKPLQLQSDAQGVALGKDPGSDEYDLRFEVTAPCENGTCLRVAASFGATCSPFIVNGGAAIAPITLVGDNPEAGGLRHPLQISATTIPAKLEGRPWVTNFTFRYCTSANDADGDPETEVCAGPNALETQHVMSLIVWPPAL